MCCLFGLIDYRGTLTAKQKTCLIRKLSIAAEVRGTDATGIAYNTERGLQIYKRPLPAHRLRLSIPGSARVIMGHTRMATQGKAKKNENNHPFRGSVEGNQFALAHNGVLYNDYQLRRTIHLPTTKIETDSYVAVQLIEHKNTLDLRYMAEQVEGSFTFTVLTERDTMYFVKGDNPLCLVQFPDIGVYVYTSTKEILDTALLGFEKLLGRPQRIPADCGEIIRVDRKGRLSRSLFDAAPLYYNHWGSYSFSLSDHHSKTEQENIRTLKSIAVCFGYTGEMIDRLLDRGFTTDEIEEWLYCGEM